jgi:aspartyl-tRNA(Asn)/glutamyl-tRNA(Gln) amidotransferase subunit B
MEYEACMGLEVHAELATDSKLFCGCSTKFGAEPNTQTCPVCIGMPGVLPVMNKKAFEFVLKTALAFHCQVPKRLNFDRKNYYYPDLPKNFQISQNYYNVGANGCVEIMVGDAVKRIGITNVHIEEDAGANKHSEDPRENFSLVDLNRAGVPLVEIVSAPDMHTPDEVDAYMRTLRNSLLYLGVSECKMQEGDLRFEASVSVREKGAAKLGSRVEMKNLNSITAVVKAVNYEIERQTDCLRRGEKIPQETRLWDDAGGKTARMRSKEASHDYRYFPEPDLVPVVVAAEWLDKVKAGVPELPVPRRVRFIRDYRLSAYDAGVLTDDRALADYFEATMKAGASPKGAANWITNEIARELNTRNITMAEWRVTPVMLAELVQAVETGKVSTAIGREVLTQMQDSGKTAGAIIAEKGLAQISDTGALEALVDKVLAANPNAVADFKKGKKEARGFLIGQVMRQTKGKANAKVVGEVLEKKLGG